jgi:sugar-specific transcriptional regulator TrmB
MNSEQILLRFGFTEKQVKVYLATLELGMAPLSVIAKRAQLKRTTAYGVIEKLISRDVAESFLMKRIRYYSVASPRRLLEMYRNHLETLENNLPELELLSNSISRKPKVHFEEGREGIRRLYMDYVNAKGEVLNYFMPEKVYEYFGEKVVQSGVSQRLGAKNLIRCILPDTPLAREIKKKESSELRQVRLVPTNQPLFTNEVIIYDDKMSMFSFHDEIGLLIQSRDMVESHRAIFELAWQGLED